MSSNPDDLERVRRLFREHVPEIASGTVEIRGLVRQPGKLSILAVFSKDPKVDPVGACVGHRGSRVKSILARLDGEFIDIYRWNESPELFIRDVMDPSTVVRTSFDEVTRQVTVTSVPDADLTPDQLELRSKLELRSRLVLQSRLILQMTGWKLKVVPPGEDDGQAEAVPA